MDYLSPNIAKNIIQIFLALFLALFSVFTYSQISCTDLDGAFVISQDGQYLGFFGSSFSSDSINNTFGTFGSQFSSTSVRNQFGTYGSQFSSYSAKNSFTTTPPIIFRRDDAIAYLSANTFLSNSVSLNEIDNSCIFSSLSPLFPFPAELSGLSASDGVYSDAVVLTWAPSLFATSYEIYVSDTVDGVRTYITETSFTSATITGGTPGQIYYYFVFPKNTEGNGTGQWDTGYITETQTPGDLLSLTASDGAFDDFVRLNWSPLSTASSYEVYFSETLDGNRNFITETSQTSLDITGGTPGKVYYYFVFPKNSTGLGGGLWDDGYVKNESTLDGGNLNKISALNLNGGSTRSKFSIGMSEIDADSFITASASNKTITVKGYFYPQSSDLGLSADIFVVVQTPHGLYMRDTEGQFVTWNGSLKSLEPAFENISLTDSLEIDLFTGSHTIEGEYKYFMGYQINGSDGLIVTPKAGKYLNSLTSNDFIWTVVKGSNKVIIAGSVHLLNPSNYPLDQDYIDAYEESDILVTEVEYEDILNVDTLSSLYLSDDDSTLSEVLSPTIYNLLALYLAGEGLNISDFESIHPNWVANFILNIEFEKSGFTDGLDLYLMKLALDEGKPNQGLESLASQITLIKKLQSEKSPDDVIWDALVSAALGIIPISVNQLITPWVSGDKEEMTELQNASREESELDYNLLLVNRNNDWIPQIEEFLDTPETEFVVVGVFHLVGPDSVIQLLRDRGYMVEMH